MLPTAGVQVTETKVGLLETCGRLWPVLPARLLGAWVAFNHSFMESSMGAVLCYRRHRDGQVIAAEGI